MQRPPGLAVVAILYLLTGGFSLATSCFAMVAGSWLIGFAARPGSRLWLLAPGVGAIVRERRRGVVVGVDGGRGGARGQEHYGREENGDAFHGDVSVGDGLHPSAEPCCAAWRARGIIGMVLPELLRERRAAAWVEPKAKPSPCGSFCLAPHRIPSSP